MDANRPVKAKGKTGRPLGRKDSAPRKAKTKNKKSANITANSRLNSPQVLNDYSEEVEEEAEAEAEEGSECEKVSREMSPQMQDAGPQISVSQSKADTSSTALPSVDDRDIVHFHSYYYNNARNVSMHNASRDGDVSIPRLQTVFQGFTSASRLPVQSMQAGMSLQQPPPRTPMEAWTFPPPQPTISSLSQLLLSSQITLSTQCVPPGNPAPFGQLPPLALSQQVPCSQTLWPLAAALSGAASGSAGAYNPSAAASARIFMPAASASGPAAHPSRPATTPPHPIAPGSAGLWAPWAIGRASLRPEGAGPLDAPGVDPLLLLRGACAPPQPPGGPGRPG